MTRIYELVILCSTGALGQYRIPVGYSSPEKSHALQTFWERADKTYAHIEYGGHLGSEAKLILFWQQRWLNRFPSNVRTVAEYGIGAGLLGQVLLQNYSIVHYIGIDISLRQLRAASQRLQSCCMHKYTLLHTEDQALGEKLLQPFHIDLFVSQAVIQHFPSDTYLQSFLAVLSRSNIRYLMLQTREGGKRGDDDVTRAQITTRKFLVAHLPKYTIVSRSPRFVNGYVFYWFEHI